MCATDLTTTRNYAGAGPLESEIRPGDGVTAYTYDARGRVETISRGPSLTDLRERIVYEYDPLHGKKSVERYEAREGTRGSRRSGRRSHTRGRATFMTVTHADATTIHYAYDAADDLESVRDENHATANTRYTYDPAGRLRRVTQTLSTVPDGQIVTTYGYDAHGSLSGVTDPNGNTTSYLYDDFGQMQQQISPVTGTTAYRYDGAGQMVRTTDANGATTTRTYDALGRALTAVSSRAGMADETVSWSYDDPAAGRFATGRLSSMTDPAGFRWYRAGWGRYTQADPIGLEGGLNLYQYAAGAPTVNFDPLGLTVNVRCRRVGRGFNLFQPRSWAGAVGFRHCYLEVTCPKAGIPPTTISYLGGNPDTQVVENYSVENADVRNSRSGNFNQFRAQPPRDSDNCNCEFEKMRGRCCETTCSGELHDHKLQRRAGTELQLVRTQADTPMRRSSTWSTTGSSRMASTVERVTLWSLMAGLGFTLIAACQPRFSSDVARELEGRVILLRPSSDGLQAVTVSREPLPAINLPTRKAVALAPDLTAYVDASAREGVLTLMLVRGDTSRVLVSEPIAATHPSRPFRVGWIKPDGTELVLLIGDRLMEFRAKGEHLDRRDLADRVRSFAVSDDAIYAVKEDARRVIEDVRSGRRIEIGEEVNELFPSLNANEVLATTADKLVIAIITTGSGGIRKASLRNVEGELRDVIPVGSGKVLVETWDGEERIDGTELSTFSLCGLDGDCSFAFKDDEHVKVHRLPAAYLTNVVPTATGATRMPTATKQ